MRGEREDDGRARTCRKINKRWTRETNMTESKMKKMTKQSKKSNDTEVISWVEKRVDFTVIHSPQPCAEGCRTPLTACTLLVPTTDVRWCWHRNCISGFNPCDWPPLPYPTRNYPPPSQTSTQTPSPPPQWLESVIGSLPPLPPQALACKSYRSSDLTNIHLTFSNFLLVKSPPKI